ncbi:MAG: HlyU family transcriptional regulator [Rhodobacteraceae bacterium]|jgi:hypothetical protein|nr:HlyU family transcriptional regulator [Paracoccaceae bacterium]
MSLWSRLFGGGGGGGPATPRHSPETHKGFTITPDPMREGPRFRIRGHVSKEVGGEMRTHTFIRADTLESEDAAVAATLGKGRQLIDEQGDRLFG